MARTVLREFTGGVSNEIDPQNLRPDQGEEALDINLKGFALEPGEGKAPIEGGHYYYRGEWIEDSKAVSFEESGVGVIKTFDEKRPEFEEVIKDDVNISRSLGPPLPPSAVITGTVASEGTRGERPAEGSHLLKLPETALGGVDSTQSLITYEANSTTIIDDIHYYNGQTYWLVKSGSDWKVVTRAKSGGEFTSTDVESSSMTHNSKGYFFRKGYFVCWDDQYIDSVALSNTSMATIDSFNTIDPNDGGDAGSAFAANAGGTFTSGATSNAITGVHIDDNGLITFSQRITTANTVPSAYTHSDNERWIRMPSGDNGCYVVFFRDGVSHSYSEAGGTSNNSTDAAVEIFTDKNKDVFTGWKTKSGGFTYSEPGRAANNQTNRTYVAKVQKQLNDYGSVDYGIKYFVAFAKNDTWVRVRYQDPVAKPPEIFVIKCTSSGSESRVDDISFSRTLTAYQSLKAKNVVKVQYAFNAVFHYDDVIDIFMTFNAISGKNKFHWRYEAPIGNNQNVTIINDWGGVQANTQCSSATRYNSSYIGGTYTENHWPRVFFWTLGETQTGTAGSHQYGGQAGTWYKYIGGNRVTERLDWLVQDGASDGSYKNNIASPSVPGKMNRLCSHVRGSNATTQQGAFSVSELWTKATFASADNSLAFAEATTKNFRVGDWIKIGQNGSNKSMHLNLRGTAKDSTYGRIKEQTFITAQITAIEEGVKLILSPPEIDSLGTGKYLDEDCYPLISGFIQYLDYKNLTIDKPNGDYPVCAVLNKDTKYAHGTGTRTTDIDAREFNENVLVGHGTGRYFNKTPFDYNKYGTFDLIEVRGAGGAEIASNELVNYSHRISWSGADSRRVGNDSIRIPHAIRAAGTTTAPKLYYTRGHDNRMLYAQNGKAADTSAKKVPLSPAGGYYVDSNYLTHFDDKGITVFSTDLSSKVFVKGNPRLSDGLGLTGNVTDAKHFVDSSNAVWVFVKIGGYWKIVKTSNDGPQSSLLSYDFKKAIGFDGTRIWGISSDSTDGWDIQYATPFFEDHIIGSWIFYANSYTTVTPTVSAWGQIVNFRIGKKEDNGTPRYLSINWKMDSGEWFGTGNPTIGLNHETQKMTSEETWKWYPIDIPSSLVTSGTATVIANIPGVTNTYDPLATIEVPFKSKIIRDVVFFKETETLPSSGDSGGEHKISFLNYSEGGQTFYVLSDNAFSIVERVGFEKEKAYRLGQATTGSNAFDASKIGISSFLIGAPNMFNAYGPNIDLYYRASFVNKWGHESAPSPLSSKGITALDSADDCIQVNFSAPFFRLTDADIEKIRLYRYGGDSSEFLHLADIEMPTLPVDSDGNKYFPTYTNLNSTTLGFSRKSATSPYYLFNTYTDISDLSGFTNSNFLLTATSSVSPANQLDGSWRVNQVSESDGNVIYLSGIGSAGDGDTANDSDAAYQYKHELFHTGSTVTGVIPAVGHFITHSKFLTGTKVTVINSTENYYFSPGALADWEPQTHGQTERGRAFEFTIPKDHTIHEVRVGGVATTAYTVTNFNGAVNEIEGSSGSSNYIDDGRFQVDIDGGNMWQSGQTHTDVDVHTAAHAGDPGTSGGGRGAKFRIVTVGENYLDNITITDMGEGYQVGDTIKVTDDGNTDYTVTVTVKSIINHDLITFDTPPASGTNNIEIVTRFQTSLAEDLNATDTTIKLNGRTGEWHGQETAESQAFYILSARHGLKHGQKIRLSTTDTFPLRNTNANLGFDLLEDTDYWVSLTDTIGPLPGADDDALTLYNNSSLTVGNTSRLCIVRSDHGLIPYSYGRGQHYFHTYLEDDDTWPTSGVVKIGEEYISYTGISGNNLTGCVRGVNGTNANDHKSGQVKAITVSAGGTNYGFDDGSGGFSSANVVATSFTDASDKIQVNATAHGMANGTALVLSTSGELPAGLSKTVLYFVVATATDSFQLATASSGTPIDVTDDDLGSGTPSFNACVIHGTGGGGTGFYATYEVNTSTGAITSASVVNGGQGYTSSPTLVVSDPGPANAGSGETLAITMDNGVSADAVAWKLEMEHRNQDTTTLTEAITSPLTGSANVLKVTDTSVFPSASASGSPGPKKLLIGSEVLTYTGKTDTTFTGVTGGTESTIASSHGLNVLVRSYDEVYNTSTVTNATIEIEDFGYRDKARTPISSLHYMQEDNYPPVGLEYNEEKKQFFETESQDDYFRYIKAVGSMYFGSLDADLRFSKYGSPEYWPVDAVVTLDSEIRWIQEHAGEGIVFTTNSVYRVRGTDPRAMVAFRVPDAKGLPAGYEHTVSDINGGLMWMTASDGLVMYSAGKVVYITRDKHDLGRLKNPYSCVVDGEYWIFQEPGSGVGYKLDLTTGDLRLSQTSIEAYYAYFAKALGIGVVVTADPVMSGTSSDIFTVEEIGGIKANNIEWRSKKIDAGEPAIPKALGSLAIVYEALNSTSGETIAGGIRGQALAAELLGLDPDDLDAGDISAGETETITDLYSIFTKYDEPNQTYIVDTDGANLTTTQRRTILMPIGFNTSSLKVGDRVWNELLADNTVVESLGTLAVDSGSPISLGHMTGLTDWLFTQPTSSLVNGDLIHFNGSTLPGGITADTNYYVVIGNTATEFRVETEANKGTGSYVPYTTPVPVGLTCVKKILQPTIVLDKEPLRTGQGRIYWGNLPLVEIYLNNDDDPARSFTLPPGDTVEPQSMDLYLNDLKRFRTVSVAIKGDVRVQSLSVRHYPLQRYQSSTLHHSADVFYKGEVDFRVMLDGSLVYRKELSNAGDDFKEERIYLPASSFGQRAHYMNESRAGMIESVNFNGSVAA